MKKEYEDFTVGLAIVDMFPVIFFCITCLIIGQKFNNIIFFTGAILTILGGFCKVLWKFILGLCRKNVWFLNRPLFIVLMPLGFALMLLAVILNVQNIDWTSIISKTLSFPTGLFILLGVLGLSSMVIFFKFHDKTDVKNNWIEQITNSFAQLMILLAVMQF